MNAAVYVNGFFIGSGGIMQEPVARNWNRILYFFTPIYLLKRGDNEVLVHVHGYANNSSGLGLVHVGPDDVLRPVYLHSSQTSDILSKGAFTLSLAIGMLFLVLWLLCKESPYFFFGMGSLITSVYIADTFVVYIPVGRNLWEWGAHSSIVISQSLYLMFMARVLKLNSPWLEKIVVAYAVTGAAGLALMSSEGMLPFASIWEGVSLLGIVAMIYLTICAWFRDGEPFQLLLTTSLTGTLFAFGHDWIPWVLGHGVAPPFLFYLGPMGFAVVVSFVLIARIVASIRNEREFALQLQQSLDEQALELKEQHSRLAELERIQAVREEQKRIVRELHDGVGGHIIGAMAQADQTDLELRDTMAAALDDLRMIMDSLDADVELLSMLGMMRQRLESRLNRRGIKLLWQVMELPETVPESAQVAMHVIRIVQESVTNSLKHADPTTLCIRTDRDSLCISDDGKGFDPARVKEGRGLKNIRWRAEQAGAACSIESGPQGTRLSLCWPTAD